MLLLAGGRLGHSAQFHQDFLLAEDQILLVVDLDVVAGVFAKQDPVAHLYVQRDAMALFHLAGSDGHYFALLRLFFSRIGDNDPAFRGFFLFQPAYQDRKSTRLNSSHGYISYAVFCLKKKNNDAIGSVEAAVRSPLLIA